MGGNAAEAHPCGFKWVVEAKAHRSARLIVVDPRFNRTASVSDVWSPIRSGTDIVFLGALINYLLTNDKIQHEYVKAYTDLPFIVREDFAFNNGIFSGYDAKAHKYADKSSWEYELGPDGYVKTDPTLTHPRCVYNLMKQHYSSYTPEMVETVCGTKKEKFLQICEMIAATAVPGKAMTIMYALGWTHHTIGAQIIRTGAMVQLLLGNIGVAGGGMNALRGHSNIQGFTDLGLMTQLLPGYLTLPHQDEQTYESYLKSRTQMPMRPNQLSVWQNYPKYHVSLMKAWWGEAATAQNNWCYDYLPKMDKMYDLIQTLELMNKGKITGYIAQGFNPLASAPDKPKTAASLAKLKWLVVMDPLATETSEFWKPHDDFNVADPAQIQTEVFRLPVTSFAEERGSFVSSSRLLQWHWQAQPGPGQTRSDLEIMAGLHLRIREAYKKDGGKFPDPIVNLDWPYFDPANPTPEELAMEYNGKALEDVTDPKDPTKVIVKKGQQLSHFSQIRGDGSTSSGCWIYCGAWSAEGNNMARRDTSDPTGMGTTLNWAWAWPDNRRILANRALADPQGKPWDPTRKVVEWNGHKWTGSDIPDYKVDEPPEDGMGPFVMNPEGVGRFFARGMMNEGPFPSHYEPMETPIGKNPVYPNNPLALHNPAVRMFPDDRKTIGDVKDYPHVASTYRLTEHFHFWTKHAKLNAIVQPQQFVEIGEELGAEIGVQAGDRVKVTSKRGYIYAVAVVTKRIKTLTVDGKKVHFVGVPLHWGFTGVTKPGYLANTLTLSVGDANSQTPAFKTFLVKVEKA
jgi:formate dehydrogenase major subunit